MRLLANRRWVSELLSRGVVFLPLIVAAVAVPRLQAEGPQRLAEQSPARSKGPDLPKQADGWGPESNGLRTRLLPTQKEYVVGGPAKFRLEMKNFGRHECTYDAQQVDCNGSIRVSNADGKPVRYVAGSFQTLGHSKSIAPERTVVLFDDLDLASQYLFVKPGSYMLQFRGTNVKWDSESQIPPSNTITVQMQPGTMPLSMQVPARLAEILPKGWDMSLNLRVSEVDNSGKITPPGYDSGRGTYLSLNRGAQYTRDVLRVQVWVAEQRLTWTGKFQAEKVRKPGEAATYLGKGADGHVYWTVPEKAETEWPDIRTKVGAALQIGPHVQGTGTSD